VDTTSKTRGIIKKWVAFIPSSGNTLYIRLNYITI
jgi:hypothetical protein